MPTAVLAAPDVGDAPPAEPVGQKSHLDPRVKRALVEDIKQIVRGDMTPEEREKVVDDFSEKLGKTFQDIARSLADRDVGRAWRTKPCKHFCRRDGDRCQYGDDCRFHHSVEMPGGPWDFHRNAVCKDDEPWACGKCGLNKGPASKAQCFCEEAEAWFTAEENISTAAEESEEAPEDAWMEEAPADDSMDAVDHGDFMNQADFDEKLHFRTPDEEILAQTRRDRVPCLFVQAENVCLVLDFVWCRISTLGWGALDEFQKEPK